MAFLIKKPVIFIIIGVVFIVLVIQLSGVFAPKPTVVITSSILPSSATIVMNQNATLTSLIRNSGQRPYSVEYHIVGFFNSSQLLFYDKISGVLLSNPGWNGKNYTIIYPTPLLMNTGDERTVSVIIKGLDPKPADPATYTIFVEVYADNILAERKSIQLTVRRS